MLHSFEVGKTYRNRAGEYVVQAIEGDWMKIRYVSGGTLETRVSIQARIWENIQFEKQVAREEERQQLAQEARQAARRRRARARREAAKPKFGGFEEEDFEAKTRGIAWKSRKELGKVLAYTLKQRTKAEFDSWIVPRQAAVHVARKENYDQAARETNAAFFVAAGEEGVTFGFQVGKPDGKVKDEWSWMVLIEALDESERVRRAFRAVMKEHELSFDVYAMDVSYGQVGTLTVQERGFLWEHETAEQEMSRKMSWVDVVEYLQNVAPGKRCALYLRKRIPPKQATKAGAGIVGQITDVFESLLPVYDASVEA
jgi:hypothetical protein